MGRSRVKREVIDLKKLEKELNNNRADVPPYRVKNESPYKIETKN